MRTPVGRSRTARTQAPITLVLDVGGTWLKAGRVDAGGRAVGAPRRAATPRPATPRAVLAAVRALALPMGPFHRVAAGFPGVVRDGVVRTAPNLARRGWRGRRLARDLERLLGRPARVVNDAVQHGLGATRGRGVELLLTLGTGLGSVLLVDGRPLPLELGHLPWRRGRTYEEVLGEAGRRRVGTARWRRLLADAVAALRSALEPDRVLLGGGNAVRLRGAPLPGTRLVPNRAAMRGGWRQWTVQRPRKRK